MQKKYVLILFAIVGSFTTWVIINFLLVPMPLWKYLIIETIIVLTKLLYEKEKERLENK